MNEFGDRRLKNTMQSALEMHESLIKAVRNAGGKTDVFASIENLDEMTIMDLFSMVATNNIRFTYIKK